MPRMTVEEYSRLTKHFAPVEVLTYDYPDGFEITPEYGVIARKDLGGGRAVDKGTRTCGDTTSSMAL